MNADSRAAREIVERILGKVPTDKQVLCIFSVTASGSFASSLERMFAAAGRSRSFRPISLYRFSDSDPRVPALCSLDQPAGYAKPEDCELCKQQSQQISVDPNVYYLREYRETGVALQEPHFQEPSLFVSKYLDGPGALAVHRNDPHDGRHHALYIDVGQLLRKENFSTRCREQIATYRGRADTVVVPSHAAGRALGEIAAEVLQVPLIVHDNLRPVEGLAEADCSRLRQARRLLILDDVLMSGSRLDGYNKALRENQETFGPFDCVHFWVGVARPESAGSLRRAEISLTKHAPWTASLGYAEKIFLPAWNEKSCPWCLEYDFLSRWSKEQAEPPRWLHQRLQYLTQKGVGISGEPLLLLPPSQPVTLGVGSLVGPAGLSSMETVFSVMAGVQNLRHDASDQKRLWRSILAANVFRPANFTNYSEALVRAALLRSLDPPELGQTARMESNEILLKALAQADQHLLIGKIVFAMYRNLLPKSSEQRLQHYTKGLLSDDALAIIRDIAAQ